ncbi:MAG: SDR family NAD(P)-dependent oxidoreductase [Alphaproteobacteria bacterium]
MGLIEGQVALITGASRGIGAAVAKKFAAEGAHVILLARTQGALEELDDEIRRAGGSATLIPQDLQKLEELDNLGPALHDKFGRLDIFVGNAGMLGPLSPVRDVGGRDWDKVFKVNALANARLIKTLDPLLRAAPSGRAIFTTTALVHQPMAYWGTYISSKAALESLVQVYAAETAKTNLRVNMVNPGIVDTAMLQEAFPGGFQGQTNNIEDVAAAFLKLALSDCVQHGEIIAA